MIATLTIDNIAPIYLSVQLTTGNLLRVFYGAVEVDDLLDDVFPETTALTNVAVNVHNAAGIKIYVTFDKQPAIEVGVNGSTSQTLQMPEPNACNSLRVVVSDGTQSHDPIIRLKRKLGNVTPTCG